MCEMRWSLSVTNTPPSPTSGGWSGRGVGADDAEGLVDVGGGLELRGELVADHTLGVDHVGDPTGEQTEGLAHAPELANGTVGVGEQREREVVLLGELQVGVDGVRADPDDLRAGLGEVLEAVAEGARFLRAAGRVVLRVEVHDDPPALLVGEGDGRAMLVRKGEVGCRLAHGCAHGGCQRRPTPGYSPDVTVVAAAGRRRGSSAVA